MSNAALLDEATAAAEAILYAKREMETDHVFAGQRWSVSWL